jgi:lysine 6-dehydrogenase
MNITVLGGGLVGSAIVKDLATAPEFSLTLVDANAATLQRLEAVAPVRGVVADLNALTDFSDLLAGAELVVCAVPGFMGFATLQKIIAAGKHVVDISFFTGRPLSARRPGAAAGRHRRGGLRRGARLGNIVFGDLARRLERIDCYECYVGGLPQTRQWPFEYKAVFLAGGCAGGVHAPGALTWNMARGRVPGALRNRAARLSTGWHAGSLQHRRAAHAGAAR